jgi:hypothetical protein
MENKKRNWQTFLDEDAPMTEANVWQAIADANENLESKHLRKSGSGSRNT